MQRWEHAKLDRVFKLRRALGNVVIESFRHEAKTGFERIMAVIADDPYASTPSGHYKRMLVGGRSVMSNMDVEKETSVDAINAARGDVLIAGLGLGLVLHPMLRKPAVHTVTIVETSPEVIALVLPTLPKTHATVITVCDDIYQWRPAPETQFDTIFFDIWDERSLHYAPDISMLYKLFRPYRRTGGWMGSWFTGLSEMLHHQQKRYKNAILKLTERFTELRVPVAVRLMLPPPNGVNPLDERVSALVTV